MRIAVAVAVAACSSPTPKPSAPDIAGPTAPASQNDSPAAPTPPALRLPGDVVPIRIALDLTVVPEKTTLSGAMHADATVVRPTRVVWLNATGLTVTSAKLDGKRVAVIPGGDDFIGLMPAAELAPGPLAIDVEYDGPIDHEKSLAVYAEQEGKDWYAYTMFEATDARRAFPCFDEPSYKIPWTLTLRVADGHVALANAAVAAIVDEPGPLQRVTMAESRPMPSYLVAFVVGPFEIVDGGTGGRIATPIRFVIPKGRARELAYAKQITPKVVAALEDYFDMDYPYGKLDVAVVPRFWGTMEHPGLVAMGQPLTLIKPEQATRGRKQAYTNILAHELAHYWFGDVVTMAWWDDTWLNEALATWLDSIITDRVEPKWRYLDDVDGEGGKSADEQLAARAIRQPVTTKEGIQASFDNGITYAKGAAVFRMLEAWVGKDKLRDFMRAYIRRFAWKNATADDFIGVMTESLGADVARAFRSFLDQPGVPRIAATIACDGSPRVELRQSRSLPAGTVDPTPRTWTVPVCVRWRAAGAKLRGPSTRRRFAVTSLRTGRECTLLDKPTAAIAVAACPTEIVVNDGAAGYYRAAYSADEVRALVDRRDGWVGSSERRDVLRDALAAVARDEIAVGDALALVPKLARDRDERVAAMAMSIVGLIDDRVLDDDLERRQRRFVRAAFGPLAGRLTWSRGDADTDDVHQLRQQVVRVVAWAGDRRLAAQASKLAAKYLATGRGIDDDLVASVLGTAIEAGGDVAMFDKIVAAAHAAAAVDDRTHHARLLGVLGAFRDPALVARALALMLDEKLDRRDTSGIVYWMLWRRETRDAAWTWIEANADAWIGSMRDDQAGWTIAGITSSACDARYRARAVALFDARSREIDGARNGFDQALESVDHCIASAKRNLPGIRAFLARY